MASIMRGWKIKLDAILIKDHNRIKLQLWQIHFLDTRQSEMLEALTPCLSFSCSIFYFSFAELTYFIACNEVISSDTKSYCKIFSRQQCFSCAKYYTRWFLFKRNCFIVIYCGVTFVALIKHSTKLFITRAVFNGPWYERLTWHVRRCRSETENRCSRTQL